MKLVIKYLKEAVVHLNPQKSYLKINFNGALGNVIEEVRNIVDKAGGSLSLEDNDLEKDDDTSVVSQK